MSAKEKGGKEIVGDDERANDKETMMELHARRVFLFECCVASLSWRSHARSFLLLLSSCYRDVFSTKSCKMCALEEHFFSKRRRRYGCRRRDSFESISFARRSVHSERISRDWSFISFGRRLCETRWLRRRLRLVGAQKLVFRTSVSTKVSLFTPKKKFKKVNWHLFFIILFTVKQI